MSDSYREDIKIDKYNLVEEWVQHSQLYCEWLDKEVDAMDARDKAETRMELKRAELSTAIRKNPAVYGLGGDKAPTEAAISITITQNKDFQKVQEEYFQAVRTAKRMTVAKLSFEHRKKALERITDLTLSGYRADPKESKDMKNRREEETKQNRDTHYKALDGLNTIKRRNT